MNQPDKTPNNLHGQIHEGANVFDILAELAPLNVIQLDAFSKRKP